MNIKYNKKKEELRKDPVLDTLERIRIFLTKNSAAVISGILVIVTVFAGFQIVSFFKKSGIQKAQIAYGSATTLYQSQDYEGAMNAFKNVIENHSNSPHAFYSSYLIGHILLGKGEFDNAIGYFEKTLNHRKNSTFLKGEAYAGIATCYESKDDLEKSLQFFKKALESSTIKYRHPAIQWKMALINKKLGKKEDVLYYCKKLVTDTLSMNYKKKAENLLATM